MANLTASRDAGRKSASGEGQVVAYYVAAGVTIWKGALVFVNDAGYLIPARATTASDKFVGVAYESFSNATGTDGAASTAVFGLSRSKTQCRVWKEGTFIFNKATASQGDIGEEVYIVDDNTVTLTASTGGQKVGSVVGAVGIINDDPSTTTVRIDIDDYVK